MKTHHALPIVFVMTTAALPVAAQTNAGTLLEQQRRLEQSAPAQAVEPGTLPATPPPGAPTEPANSRPNTVTHTVVRAFVVEGSTLVEPAALQAVLQPWVGRPVGLADLRQATAALEELFRQRGWLARVGLPGQDITDGTVRFTVTESRLGRTVLRQGQSDMPPLGAALTERVQALLDHYLPAGQPLSLAAMERALLLADALPGVRASGSLQASEIPGSTDLLVALHPSQPWRGEASVDNGGNRATGIERATAQLQLLSPLGQGEQFSLGGSASRGSQYLSLGASAPLPGSLGHQGWRAVGSASVLRYQVLESRNTTTGLAPQGSSNSLGASLQYPLVRTALAQWLLSAGVTQTRLLNRDDNLTLGQRDTTSQARSRALQLSLGGSQFDRWQGGGSHSASIAFTSGHLNLAGSPATYTSGDSQTAATQGPYNKLRWSASRLQTLTASTSALLAATGQLASTNLDPSEKIYLGGMQGVRAYPNAEGGGSTGTQISLDLLHDLSPQWQASAFYDWGQVQQYKHNHYSGTATPLVAHNRTTLQGAGLGLLWRGGHGTQIQASWAHRIGSNPLATSTGADTDGSLHSQRFWLNASVAF